MSFGKDQAQLQGVPVYGGTSTQRAANAGRKKSRNYGNKRPYWVDGFKLSETQISDIRLVPGSFEVSEVDGEQIITEVLP